MFQYRLQTLFFAITFFAIVIAYLMTLQEYSWYFLLHWGLPLLLASLSIAGIVYLTGDARAFASGMAIAEGVFAFAVVTLFEIHNLSNWLATYSPQYELLFMVGVAFPLFVGAVSVSMRRFTRWMEARRESPSRSD